MEGVRYIVACWWMNVSHCNQATFVSLSLWFFPTDTPNACSAAPSSRPPRQRMGRGRGGRSVLQFARGETWPDLNASKSCQILAPLSRWKKHHQVPTGLVGCWPGKYSLAVLLMGCWMPCRMTIRWPENSYLWVILRCFWWVLVTMAGFQYWLTGFHATWRRDVGGAVRIQFKKNWQL